MQLSLLVLKNNTVLVSQSEKLDYEPACHLVNPCTVSGTTKLTLTRWTAHTDDEHILFNSENLLTVCEPSAKLAEAYMKKFKLKESDFSETATKEQEPVMLNEEAPDVQGVPDFDDEYEPRYVEEF